MKRTHQLFIGIILLFATLSIAGGVKHYLWGDEAETALFAKNILKYGLPYGWNGKNILGLYNGIVLDNRLLNNITPWGQYYLVAASFMLFGTSTLAARLPFIIFGILSVIGYFICVRTLFKNEKFALLSTFLLAVSVPFILFTYQSRYYSMTFFLTVALFWLFITDRLNRGQSIALITIIGIVFFHAHYLSFICFYASLVFWKLIFTQQRKEWGIRIFLSSLFILPFTASWILYANPYSTQTSFAYTNFSTPNAIELFMRYTIDFNENGGFLMGLSIVIIWLFLHHKKIITNKSFIFTSFVTISALIILCFLSPQRIDISSKSYIRYGMNLFPLLFLMSTYVLYLCYSLNKRLGIFLFVAMISSNLLTLQPPFVSWLALYLNEMSTPYNTSTKAVVDYLNDKVLDGQTAFVTPDYNVEPIQFYLDDRLRFINRITETNSRIKNNSREALPQYIFNSPDAPDWIIQFSKLEGQFNWRTLPKNVDLNRYEEIVLNVAATDHTRPEIFDHKFVPQKPTNEKIKVYIYVKKSLTQK